MPPGGGISSNGGAIDALVRHDEMAHYTFTLEREWARLRPGEPARFRLLNERHAVIQDGAGELWGYVAKRLNMSPFCKLASKADNMITNLQESKPALPKTFFFLSSKPDNL